jgi:hypothetical protein
MQRNQQYEYVAVVTQDESSFFSFILILAGYDIGQQRNRRVKILLNIALVVHAISFAATIVSWKGGCLLVTNACLEAHDSPHTSKSFLYSFYRPTITGDRSKAHDSASSSFIRVVEDAYSDTCVDGSSPPHLLKLRAAFENATSAHEDILTLTWMPTVISFFGIDHANGYIYLSVMFAISFFFQLVSLYEANQNNNNFFETPCSWRWLEYALTSPMDNAQKETKAIDFQEVIALPVDKSPQTWPHQKNRLWWFSFLASGALHVTIWHVLIAHFINTSQDTDCLQSPEAREQSDTWRNAMIVVLTGQCLSFTLFALVPIYQAFQVGILPWKSDKYNGLTQEENVRRVMRKGFEIYSILSFSAKFILGVTYISFVRLFPFYTSTH